MLMESRGAFKVKEAEHGGRCAGGPATLLCREVIDETQDCKSFLFEDSKGRAFDFKPGQYACFKFDIDGKVFPRTYSISSPPTRPRSLRVTVKRVPGGVVSNWLNDHMRAGMAVEIADIGGRFNYLDIPSRKPMFLSGGSGVTPVMSMLQYIVDRAGLTDAVFVHFARTPKDIIFRSELHSIADKFRNICVHLVVGSRADDPGFEGRVGRIDAALLADLVPDLSEREIFMCGPEGFMKAARSAAKELSVATLHEESFGERIAITQEGTVGDFEVYFSRSAKHATCGPGETLLEAAIRAGLWIDTSCQQGVCGSCKVLMSQGKVEMDDLGGLSDSEKLSGYVLPCCARPLAPVSLEA